MRRVPLKLTDDSTFEDFQAALSIAGLKPYSRRDSGGNIVKTIDPDWVLNWKGLPPEMVSKLSMLEAEVDEFDEVIAWVHHDGGAS